jgi:hypothetical protein
LAPATLAIKNYITNTGKMNIITPQEVRDFFTTADDEELEAFIEDGLGYLIEMLEQDDYFGTEGFNKRFA